MFDRARQGVSDDERRRSEIVRFHLRVDAAFEVPVAGQDGATVRSLSAIAFAHFIRQRTAVADTGRATVSGEVEAELLQRLEQVRLSSNIR